MKRWLLVFSLCLLGLTSSIDSVFAQEVRRDLLLNPPTQSELQDLSGKPTNRINIPGLNYSDIKQVDENDGTYLYIPFLGEYIAAMYRYLVVLASLLAVIIIIVSGIQWTASAGNSSTIESAKKRITGALTGLGLAVGSYVILYSINPELVAFRSLKLKYVEGIPIPSEYGDHDIVPSSLTGDYETSGDSVIPCKFKTECCKAVGNVKNREESQKNMSKISGFPNGGGLYMHKYTKPWMDKIAQEIKNHPKYNTYNFCTKYTTTADGKPLLDKKGNPKIEQSCPFGFLWRPLKIPRILKNGLYKDYFNTCVNSMKSYRKNRQFCDTYVIKPKDISFHGFGTALDINPYGNPNCKVVKRCDVENNGKVIQDMPQWVIDIFTRNHFVHLAHDPMHFEWDGTCPENWQDL